jgi:hypothetical protein
MLGASCSPIADRIRGCGAADNQRDLRPTLRFRFPTYDYSRLDPRTYTFGQ